jgi:SAM-dependent methyltransferase
MTGSERISDAGDAFERMWRRGNPWRHEDSAYDQASYGRQLGLLEDRRYAQALELGCGSGSFTHRLVQIADRVVAIDVAPSAIERARRTVTGDGIDFRAIDVMDYDASAEGPWDLIVMSETIYAVASHYSFFDVASLATRLFDATAHGGRLLMANTVWPKDLLARAELVRTYRDLFVNIGYSLEAEDDFRGVKNGIELEALISLFAKR